MWNVIQKFRTSPWVCGGEAWVLVWVYGSTHLKVCVENFGEEDNVTRWKVDNDLNEDSS